MAVLKSCDLTFESCKQLANVDGLRGLAGMAVLKSLALKVKECPQLSNVDGYVATKSIRHLDEIYSSNFVNFRSQTLEGPFSAVSTPIFAIKYSLESS